MNVDHLWTTLWAKMVQDPRSSHWLEYFNRIAPNELEPWQLTGFINRQHFDERTQWVKLAIQSLSKSVSQAKALDVGCNSGVYTELLNTYGYKTIGVEYSEPVLERANKLYPQFEFSKGSVYDLKNWHGTQSVVLGAGLLACLQEWDSAIQEMARCLQPGGSLVLEFNRAQPRIVNFLRTLKNVVFDRHPWRQAWRNFLMTSPQGTLESRIKRLRPQDVIYTTPAEVVDWLESNGFVATQVFSYTNDPQRSLRRLIKPGFSFVVVAQPRTGQ